MMMLVKSWLKKKPDTVVEIFLNARYWRARDLRNGEILCHSETYSRTAHAVEGGKKFAERLKRVRVDILS